MMIPSSTHSHILTFDGIPLASVTPHTTRNTPVFRRQTTTDVFQFRTDPNAHNSREPRTFAKERCAMRNMRYDVAHVVRCRRRCRLHSYRISPTSILLAIQPSQPVAPIQCARLCVCVVCVLNTQPTFTARSRESNGCVRKQ